MSKTMTQDAIAHSGATKVPDRLKQMVLEALGSGLTQAEVLELLHNYGDKYPDYAEQVETSDELEVDGTPLYSYGEDGVWVSAWVFVRHPETDEDDEPSPCRQHKDTGRGVCCYCGVGI